MQANKVCLRQHPADTSSKATQAVRLGLVALGRKVTPVFIPSYERAISMLKKLFLIICTFAFTSADANSEEIFLVCSVKGKERNFGVSGPPNLLQRDISLEVLVRIGVLLNKPTSLWVEPQTDLYNGLIFSNSPPEFSVSETVLSIRKRFVQDISNWEQSASLNRITLFLKVHVSREYIKPPLAGLSIDYSGTCSPTNRKI